MLEPQIQFQGGLCQLPGLHAHSLVHLAPAPSGAAPHEGLAPSTRGGHRCCCKGPAMQLWPWSAGGPWERPAPSRRDSQEAVTPVATEQPCRDAGLSHRCQLNTGVGRGDPGPCWLPGQPSTGVLGGTAGGQAVGRPRPRSHATRPSPQHPRVSALGPYLKAGSLQILDIFLFVPVFLLSH